MELGQLKIFLAVIDHGGFRRAAARLYLSQPAVSRHIADLERSLGVGLFHREKGRVWLTASGERFAERAQRIVDQCEEAVREARAEPLTGELRIGINPGAVVEMTDPILRQLARALPGVQVKPIPVPVLLWREAPPPGMDLLMVRDPVRSEAARATTVLDEPMVLAIPERLDLAEPSVSLAEAVELPMVRFSPDSPRRLSEFWSLAAARNFTAGDFRGEGAQTAAAMAESVARGVGVAVASPSLCRYYGQSFARIRPIRDGPRVRGLVTSRLDDRRPVIEAAHRQIEAVVRQIGPLVLPELPSSMTAP